MKPSNATSSSGMTLVDAEGNSWIDMAAALASTLGHRHPAVVSAIEQATALHLGSPDDPLVSRWHERLGDLSTGFSRALLFSSANDANESALELVRSFFGGNRYRVITLLGSDHGDTFLLRSAGGRIDRQGDDGPVAAGFRHVMPGEIDAITKVIDASTAAICLSPVDWNRGGEAFDTEFLAAVETLCVERDLLLMIDETKIPLGVGGTRFFHERAGITADIVTTSAGWAGGLPCGMTLVGSRLEPQVSSATSDYPVIRSAIEATASVVQNQKLLLQIGEMADEWAAMLDDLSGGFDFIRSCVHAGLWTTVELDLPAVDVAKSALREGLRLHVTGDTSLLLCPPLNVTDSNLLEAIEPLRRILESIERETTSS